METGEATRHGTVAHCAVCDAWLAVDDAGGLVCPTTRHCDECETELNHANAFACPCDLGTCPFCGDQSAGTDSHCEHYLWSSGDYSEDLGIPGVDEDALDEDALDEDELEEDEPEAGILQRRWSDAELDAALGPARPLFTDLVQIGSVLASGMSRRLFGSTLLCLVTAPMALVSWGGWHPGADGGTAYFARDPAGVWAEADGLLRRLEAGLAVLTAQYAFAQHADQDDVAE